METMTVPLLTLVTGLIIWCAWLTRELYRSQKDIAINTANDSAVKTQITEVKTDMNTRIDKFENHVNQKFDRVFEKLDRLPRQ